MVLGGAAPETVQLFINVLGPDGQPSPAAQPLVRSTAGKVADLRRVGVGRFRALLAPPRDRFPQLAVVNVADVAPVVRGQPPVVSAIGIAYSARIDLRGRAERGSSMRVEVAGKRYGPARVGRDGRFVVPIVVPPGVGWANGVATDSLGNTSRSRINLFLPAVRQLHAFVYPEVLIADGTDQGWLFVTTVDTKGAPINAPVQIDPGRGEIGEPVSQEVGLMRWPYRAPAQLGDGRDQVALHLHKGRRNAVEVKVALELMAGAPSSVEVTTAPRFAAADGETPVEIRVVLRDAKGNPAGGHQILAKLEDETLVGVNVGPGVYRVELPPRRTIGTAEVTIATVPRTHRCPRPWAGRAPDGTHRVRDVRGIACQLPFAVLDATGKIPFRGVTTEMGVLSLPPEYPPGETRLIVEGVAGGSPDILWVGGDQVSEPVKTDFQTTVATWRLATAVTLALAPAEKIAGGLALAVTVDGIPAAQLRGRLVAKASRGAVTIEIGAEGDVSVRVTGLETVADATAGSTTGVDVVVRDNETGVSTWLHVD